MYICLILHQLFDDAKLKIKVYWGFVVFTTGLILITIYACQFDFVADQLTALWPSSLDRCFFLLFLLFILYLFVYYLILLFYYFII